MEAGNERTIWADVVAAIEQRVDTRAESEWATPDAITVPPMMYAAPGAIEVTRTQTSINKAALAKKFEAAAAD